MHLQKPINDWTDGLIPGLDQVVKFVDNVQALKDAKLVNHQCKTVLRHWYDPDQVFGGTHAEIMDRPRKFFATFVDETFREYAQYVDYIEGWNEYLANSQNEEEIGDRLDWAHAAAWVWKYEYRTQEDYNHIKLIICNTAIGNDIPRGFAEIADEFDCVLGYHPYTHYQKGKRNPGDWHWLSGRWDSMDTRWGLKPTWAFTEAGPYEAAETGWRAPECLGGNRDAYVEAMRQWYLDVKGTAAYKEGRIVGADYPAAVFNSGSGGSGAWKTFENSRDELVALAEMFEAEREIVPGPPLPPPLPEPGVGFVRVVSGIGHLNFRIGPGINYEDIGDLEPSGGPLEIVDRDGDWYKLAAWAHGDYLVHAETGDPLENDPNER